MAEKIYQYNTIAAASEGSYKEKSSKFLAFCFPVNTENEIKNLLDHTKKEHPTARHICYAWSLGIHPAKHRSFDAGEPSGTAGKPIYNLILSKEITNVLIVVVRYFGGSKLGVPGLIHAYKSAAEEAISNTSIVVDFVKDAFSLSFQYMDMNPIMKLIKEYQVSYRNESFDLSCSIEIFIKKSESDNFQKQLKEIKSVLIKEIGK